MNRPWTRKISILLGLLYGTACIAAQVSTQSALQAPRPSAPPKLVMAPPLETRATMSLRPSTAEAGQSRTAKPPLRALPAIGVSSSGSRKLSVGSLQHTGHWLLLYRTDRCVACDRLMNVLAASGSADLRNGIPYSIVVGGPAAAALENIRRQYGTLAAASWIADRDRSTFIALQLRGAPELFAMDGDRVVWKVSGNLGNPQQVLHMADSWIAGSAAAEAAAKEKSVAATRASIVPPPAKQ